MNTLDTQRLDQVNPSLNSRVQILIIDDDPFIQLMLRKMLQGQGYDVSVAKDGAEGLQQAQQFRPALIICDWMMPDTSGLEVCRRIKADPTLSRAFFILLTARTAVEDRIEGLDAGADEFLSKPIEGNELKARVRSGLRLYHSTQELQKLASDLQIQKQALETELAEAADYVRALLPSPVSEGVTIESQFLPSKQLGGDCFDYYWLDPDYLAIYLLDVSGHGLGSALPSVWIQNLLRSQSLDGVNFYQPSSVLRALNEIFQMSEQNARYFTIWYGVYNQQKRQLHYASAGHPPALLISGDSATPAQVKRLRTRGAPIGVFKDAKFMSESCSVTEGSQLYIFSDGVYEVKLKNGEFWSLDSFIDLLESYHNTTTRYDLEQLLQEIQNLKGRNAFEDDCSLLRVSF